MSHPFRSAMIHSVFSFYVQIPVLWKKTRTAITNPCMHTNLAESGAFRYRCRYILVFRVDGPIAEYDPVICQGVGS